MCERACVGGCLVPPATKESPSTTYTSARMNCMCEGEREREEGERCVRG